MKAILIIALSILTGHFLFSQNPNSMLESLPKYPLKSVSYYCQSQPDNCIGKTEFTYNEQKKVIRSKSIELDSSYRVTTQYVYDSAGRVISIISSNGQNKIFRYNAKSELIYEGCDNIQKCPEHTNLYNDKGQLLSTTISGNDWGVVYSYEYDSIGRLIKQFKDDKPEITYEYLNIFLVKDITYENERRIETLYEYDKSGHLLKKTQNGKAIKLYVYKGEQLTERRDSYFGIDPCFFMPCCSQTLGKYEYYPK